MIRLEVWADVGCPWCALGHRRLEQALAGWEHADEVEVTWRAFELDPDAPLVPGTTAVEVLTWKTGKTPAEIRENMAHLTELARLDGLDLHLPDGRPVRTFDAHRLVKLAGEQGKATDVLGRLFRAHHTDHRNVADPSVLAEVAAEAGLDAEAVRLALAEDRHRGEVEADERVAEDLGIRGVPAFVFDRSFAVTGAQSSEALVQLLERARTEAASA